MSNHAEACAAEVTELHRFFVEWMTAAVPRQAEVFSRVGNVLATEFLIVSPARLGDRARPAHHRA